MTFYGSSPEHEPVTWWRGHAIYAAHLVVLVFVASMITTAILRFSHADALLAWLPYSSAAVLHGQVWRVFTYGLVNQPTLWFAIDMLMLVWFGREVEKFFGRRKFLTLYGCTYLLLPLLFTVLGPWLPTMLVGESASFAMFIAFATLYPNVPVFFTLLAKWVAVILVAIYTLAALADRNWETLLSLWATSGFAYAYVRVQQGQFTLPKFPTRRKRTLRAVPTAPARTVKRDPIETSTAEVDALLDKIAESGFASLTAKEREKLELARRQLKNRSGG
jgi:membrane associated rhomboid family serine protease